MSEKIAFVTGMPRSRTAWFANYLTYSDSFFYHDPFVSTGINEMIGILAFNEMWKHRGISDASLLTHWRRFTKVFPMARWVVIQRPFDEVLESCEQFIEIDRDKLLESAEELGNLISEVKPMIVDFRTITPDKALSVANFFGINAGGWARAEMLCRFNVQIHPPLLKQGIDQVLMNETVLA